MGNKKHNNQSGNTNDVFTTPKTLVRYRGLTEDDHISVFGEMSVQQRIALNQLRQYRSTRYDVT